MNSEHNGSPSVHRSTFIVAPCDVPSPPWELRGAALALPQRVRGGLGVLALAHYESSPVGPYDELAVAALTRRGPSVVAMQVTSEYSVRGGRRGWGYPKTLAPLRWQRRNGRVVFTAGKKRWRVRPCGPSFPVRLRFWTVQSLDGVPVRAPFQLSGRACLAFAGRRVALLVEPFALRVLPPQPL